jgi:hypothetical protein
MQHKTLLSAWNKTRTAFCSIFFQFIFTLLFSGSILFAQSTGTNLEPARFTIGFGETLKFPLQDSVHFSHTAWNIRELHESDILVQGVGIHLNDYVFDHPGQYLIVLQETNMHADEKSQGCNHSNVPSEIVVTVRPYRVVFFFEGISYSNVLRGGIDIDGTMLNVPVKIESYLNQEVDVSNFYIKSAGVGTTIEGKIINESNTLFPGTHSLSYGLNGTAEKNTYIMFDFFNEKEMLGTYYFPQILN